MNKKNNHNENGPKRSNGHATHGNVSWNGVEAELSRRKSFWEKTKYGGGCQGIPINVEIFNPAFLDGRFTWNEIGFLATFTFVAWKNWDFRILMTQPFLQEGLAHRGMASDGSIKRFKRKWVKAGHLKRVRFGGLNGNEYLVSSLLLQKSVAEKMANYDLAAELVIKADAKAKKEKAEAEVESKWREAERLKQQKQWLAACVEARASGRSEPPPEQYIN